MNLVAVHTIIVKLAFYSTCLLDNYGIIQASISMASGRKGDTLIRFEIQVVLSDLAIRSHLRTGCEIL